MASIPSIIEFARAGKARFIAVSSEARMKEFPDVPTFKELGYPQLVTDDFFGFFLPAGASPAAIASLNRSVLNAMKDEKVVSQLERMGLIINPTPTPAAFSAFIDQEYRKWGMIAKQVNFNPLA
jgi:tripartite-type tricarboxylate transporter receptor subunit TctC